MDSYEQRARRRELEQLAHWIDHPLLVIDCGFYNNAAYIRHYIHGHTYPAIETLCVWEGGTWAPLGNPTQQDPHPPF